MHYNLQVIGVFASDIQWQLGQPHSERNCYNNI